VAASGDPVLPSADDDCQICFALGHHPAASVDFSAATVAAAFGESAWLKSPMQTKSFPKTFCTSALTRASDMNLVEEIRHPTWERVHKPTQYELDRERCRNAASPSGALDWQSYKDCMDATGRYPKFSDMEKRL
jgi:hypothetical protein